MKKGITGEADIIKNKKKCYLFVKKKNVIFFLENYKKKKMENVFKFEKLSKQILMQILFVLSVKEIAKMMRINKFFNQFLKNSYYGNTLWKNIYARDLGEIPEEEAIKSFHIEYNKEKSNLWMNLYKASDFLQWDLIKKGKQLNISPDKKSLSYGI